MSAKDHLMFCKCYFGSFILVGAFFLKIGTFALDIAFRASRLRSTPLGPPHWSGF